jgi:hypothetical protein
MYLSTKGKPKKVPLKLCKDAIKWYGRKLLTERIYNEIEILLEFDPTLTKDNLYGCVDWNDSSSKSRDFTISMDPNLGKRNMLIVLAHEMVHVKQYAKGELKDFVYGTRVKFKGSIIDDNKVDYWDQPWEIEAHGREKGLYLKFLQYEKDKI